MAKKIMYLLLAVLWICSSCNENSKNKKNEGSIIFIDDTVRTASANNIVENIAQLKDLSMFEGILTSSELIETLKKPGPFTVFAPTNEAFEKLPPGMINELMNQRKSDLINLIGSHIVAGLLKTNELRDGDRLKAVSGEELIVSLKNKDMLINNAGVSHSDIISGNGVIHIIDKVIIPRNEKHK